MHWCLCKWSSSLSDKQVISRFNSEDTKREYKMKSKELMLRCTCGDEVLIIDNFDNDYIISFRHMPERQSLRNKIRHIWWALTGQSVNEVVLNKNQMAILKKWLEGVDNG